MIDVFYLDGTGNDNIEKGGCIVVGAREDGNISFINPIIKKLESDESYQMDFLYEISNTMHPWFTDNKNNSFSVYRKEVPEVLKVEYVRRVGSYSNNNTWERMYTNAEYFKFKWFNSGRYKKGDLLFMFFYGKEPFLQLFGESWRSPHEYNTNVTLIKNEIVERVRKYDAEALEVSNKEKLSEEARRNAAIQENWQEKMRLARENEALKDRLEIEKRAEEEKNRILAERLEAQKRAMEEETRLTREILEMREKIERQELDATTKTLESIAGLFGKK